MLDGKLQLQIRTKKLVLAYFSSRGSVTKINPNFFWLNIYQLNMPICNLHWLAFFILQKNLTFMIDRWRYFCYNVNLILSPKKA